MKFLVLWGDGINCEKETSKALESVGFQTQWVHVNQLEGGHLKKAQGLALPGGFSFGDDLGSGRVLSLKLESKLKDQLLNFSSQQKPILGICNGFQVLVKLGLLGEQKFTLAPNKQGHFINKWVELECDPSSPWFHRCEKKFWLPIRHGEGRVQAANDLPTSVSVPLRYTEDVNGSLDNIAALTSGWIMGMMPHPEAAMDAGLVPEGLMKYGPGRRIFESIKAAL